MIMNAFIEIHEFLHLTTIWILRSVGIELYRRLIFMPESWSKQLDDGLRGDLST